jgi:hypothetical protein
MKDDVETGYAAAAEWRCPEFSGTMQLAILPLAPLYREYVCAKWRHRFEKCQRRHYDFGWTYQND